MAYLSKIGVITYNGYTFDGPRNSVQLEVIPVRDDTDRYVTHSIYRFAVDAWVTSNVSGVTGDGTDASSHLTTIRGALQQDGGALTITGHGFGDVVVNSSAGDRDVLWGPKTKVLQMRNIGNGCVVLVWVVEVAIKTCAAGSLAGVIGRLKEYAYAVRWSIKPNGCTIRTVEGHLEIFLAPDTVGGKTFSQSADNYRDTVAVPVQSGFYRKSQEYNLSKNKARLEFRVTDEEPESDNILPPGVSDADIDHTISSDLFGQGGGFTHQFAQFSGYVEIARPFSIVLGWEKILLLIQERLVHAVNNSTFPLIDFVSITESLFSRRVSFVVRYRLLASSLNQLVTGSGLFTTVTSTNIRSYQQSMLIAWANRGAARLMHNPSSDQLVDQCNGNPDITILDQMAPYFLSGSGGSLYLVCPPSDSSYLRYNNLIDFEGTADNITLSTMPKGPTTSSQTVDTSLSKYETLGYGNGARSRRQKTQSSGDGLPTVQIVVRGAACRVGFPPEVPVLAKIMGQTPGFVMSKSHQTVTQTGFYGECPIYEGNWYHVYDVQFSSFSAMAAALKLGLTDLLWGTLSGSDPKKKGPAK